MHKDERQTIVKERHKIYQEKNKPEPPLEDMITSMRRKAKALGFLPPDAPDTI